MRRAVPVRTFSDWGDPAPGFFEADLVAHSGPKAAGSFVQTLVITDIASGWTEFAPLLVREQRLLTEVLGVMQSQIPMRVLGLDTDNDSVFMNETVLEWCAKAGAEFTRCRPYRKNDQAWVEQKNGAVVRRLVGYRRYEGVAAATLLAELYALARLFVNIFQPSFKLAAKERNWRARHRHRRQERSPMTDEIITLLGGKEVGRVRQNARGHLIFTYNQTGDQPKTPIHCRCPCRLQQLSTALT